MQLWYYVIVQNLYKYTNTLSDIQFLKFVKKNQSYLALLLNYFKLRIKFL